MTYILGLNAYHGDSSACILADGKLIAAVEEERFTRIKHWAGLPVQAVKYCLDEAGVRMEDVDYIAINRDPTANVMRKSFFAFTKKPPLKLIANRLRNAHKISDIKETLCNELGIPDSIKARVYNVEHHISHLASSFFVSPFKEAAVVSVDGFGDFVGTMWGTAANNIINVKHRSFFPHSLGLFYLAITQYLGFPNYGDEYKVMGLSAYGRPEYMDEMREIVKSDYRFGMFELDTDCFIHQSKGIEMTWNNGQPRMGAVFSEKIESMLGPRRGKNEELDKRHMNIAASLQKRYEEVLFEILDHVYDETRHSNLAMAGGCAMNSLANGKILKNTPFRDLYIQPAAGDAGGSVGAAFYVWNQALNNPRSFVLDKPYLGREFDDAEVEQVLKAHREELLREQCEVERIDDVNDLCRNTAQSISEGKVIGWFQGRMEWGARALGNRSILGDPRRADMKKILNLKIKKRESFRPFAPSIHYEAVKEYFENDQPDPFMLKVSKINPGKRDEIPAVTHVDGTGRLQTVMRDVNPRYWQLIEEFRKITNVPVVLNTSFNENEPIVCRPEEALSCFLRTKMDVLVLGNFMIRRIESCAA